jgi:hypothetical protein
MHLSLLLVTLFATRCAAGPAATSHLKHHRSQRPSFQGDGSRQRLQNYWDTPIWPLPVNTVGISGGATLDPSNFTIVVPNGDTYLQHVATM